MIIIPSFATAAEFSRVDASAASEAIGEWERAGFGRIELTPQSREPILDASRMVEEILRDVHIPVQVAARPGSSDDIDAILAAGAAFAVLGARALDEPDWLHSVAGRFPEQLIVATPARERRTRSRGAVRTLPLDIRDMASELSELHLGGIMVTFAPDAEIGHAELALLEDVVDESTTPVLVSVGSPTLTTLRDLEFRGIFATVISGAYLSAAFDGQTLARSFAD
jgi:phosphoribosylformimino-5-aminoimidazole carboxamide ribonucleotide (ProFAR) isomerase